METYRAIRWDNIVLKKTLVDSAATPYATDTALAGDPQNGNYDVTDTLLASTYCNTTPTPVTCLPVQSPVTGPSGGSYRIDSYVTWTCAVGTFSTTSPYTTAAPGCTGTAAARPSKRVTVVVRDPSTPTTVLFRESSTFDQATG
jgi:hypothetical protein